MTDQVSMAALREAMMRGSLYASTGADFRDIDAQDGVIVASAVAESLIRFINQDGKTVYEDAGMSATYRPGAADRWLRIELTDARGGLAWSQPLWLD